MAEQQPTPRKSLWDVTLLALDESTGEKINKEKRLKQEQSLLCRLSHVLPQQTNRLRCQSDLQGSGSSGRDGSSLGPDRLLLTRDSEVPVSKKHMSSCQLPGNTWVALQKAAVPLPSWRMSHTHAHEGYMTHAQRGVQILHLFSNSPPPCLYFGPFKARQYAPAFV